MRSFNLFILSGAMCLVLVGCGTGVAPSTQGTTDRNTTGGPSAGDGTTQDGTSTNGAGSNGSETQDPGQQTGSGEPATPTSEEVASALAVSSAKSVAGAVAAILTLRDVQAIFESGQAPPACPSLTTGELTSPLAITLEYGTGCQPAVFGQATISGTAQGEFFTAFNAFNMTLTAVSVNGDPITGTVSGSITRSPGVANFLGTLDASVTGGVVVRGSITVSVTEGTGAMTIQNASLTVTDDSGNVRSVDLQSAVVDPTTSGDFAPIEGTAVVTGSDGGSPAVQRITFP